MELNGTNSEPSPSTSYCCTYAAYEEEPVKETLFGYARNEIVIAPWATRRYSLSIDGLHDEIIDLFDWLKPSKIETEVRYNVYDKMKKVILRRWKDSDVQVSVFGSLRTELFLPTSDIDVLVECPEWGSSVPLDILEETAGALRESGLAEKVDVYSGAYIPIVKMVDKDTKLSLDISFNTVQGMKAANYIEKKKREYPVIEPMVLILKQFLIQRNLNQTYTGGLSSYGLILMTISFLQMYETRVRGRDYRSVNLGELLIRFFEVYGQEFNYQNVRINVAACRYEKKRPVKDHYPTLSLEDPLLSTNEVGKSTYNFAAVQQSFLQALQVLKGVYVRDRRRSSVFCNKAYRGNMMSLIIPFSGHQITYRNWLKSSSMSHKNSQRTNSKGQEEELEGIRTSQLVTNTFLAPVLNLDAVRWHDALIRSTKEKKVLSLQQPDSVKKSLAELRNDLVNSDDVRKQENFPNAPERRHSDGESMQRKNGSANSGFPTRPANDFNRIPNGNKVGSSFLKAQTRVNGNSFNCNKNDDPRSPSPSENATPRNGTSQTSPHPRESLRPAERSRSTSTGDRRPSTFAGAVVFRNSNTKEAASSPLAQPNTIQGTQMSTMHRNKQNPFVKNGRSDKANFPKNGFTITPDIRKNENFPQLQHTTVPHVRSDTFPVISGRNGTSSYLNAVNHSVSNPIESFNSESGNGTGSDCDSIGGSREPGENCALFEVVKKKKSLKSR